ncbi:MAG: glutamate-5-semialdehyde dehydrogenase, partial [Ilumatobacter sp.]
RPLGRLTAGQVIVVGGDRVLEVDEELAAAFVEGDRLLVADESLVHVRADDIRAADRAVSAASSAFAGLEHCSDE